MPKSPFPPFPLTTLPRSFDPGDWTKIKAAFDALDARGVKSPKEMESWLLAFSELAAALSQEEARRYIAMTRRTDDRKIEKSYLDFQRDILPKAKPRWDALKRRCLSLPARRKLPKRRYAVLDRQIENEVAIYRKANVPLETREAELAQRYSKIMGAMTVAYDGKERTLQQMARYGELLDPRVRKEAWTLVAGRYLKDRDAVDGIFDDLVKIRDTMGRNAGFPTTATTRCACASASTTARRSAYYIEYAISMIGALQVWQNARKDRPKALKRYRAALALGGSRPLPELFEAAGCRFDFGEKTLGPLVKAVVAEIDRLT